MPSAVSSQHGKARRDNDGIERIGANIAERELAVPFVRETQQLGEHVLRFPFQLTETIANGAVSCVHTTASGWAARIALVSCGHHSMTSFRPHQHRPRNRMPSALES